MVENNDSERNNDRRFFSAPSLERAVLEAARHYDLPPEELAYEPIDKRQGLIKRRKVVIKVDPASPRLAAPRLATPASERKQAARTEAATGTPAEAPTETATETELSEQATGMRSEPPRPPDVAQPPPTDERPPVAAAHPIALAPAVEPAASASAPSGGSAADGGWASLPDSPAELRRRRPAASARAVAAARSGLDLLFGLAGLELDAEVYQGAEGIEVELSGSHADQVLEDEGQVLRALEHLLPRVMLQDLGEVIGCAIDCEGFQILREERLRSRAQQAAAEVRRRGAAETLEPMHPADRRVVHLVLADDAAVTTESVGRGYFRRVTVRPV